ncbi:unnamed protein product [Clonostachys rhizophaga]|uniref:Zn(2)-C6 fungal-type domain-containing protein n=1 Tax=Clonostachys rhizophaga TaxID=160324 RepID=A0A9N9YVW8_9HYPO|nr:unnamed protein product [Clonostachys rhizophaga]
MDSTATGRRQGLRKGTRSCWECKRRKTRCIFSSGAAHTAPCTGCQRRGLACVSQEVPEETARPTVPYQPLNDRLVRVEKLLEEIAAKQDSGATPTRHSDPGNVFNVNSDVVYTPGISACMALYEGCDGEYVCLNRRHFENMPRQPREQPEKLQAVLPTTEDMGIIARVISHDALYYHLMMAMPYTQARFPTSNTLSSLATLPDLTSHPVLIAKRLLTIATFLQGMGPGHRNQSMRLSMPVDAMKTCLVDVATRLVETRDDQIRYMEQVECILLEAVFHANCGNLRRCWLAARRLMAIGQLLGMNRPGRQLVQFLDAENAADPPFMYFQITYMERVLSLLLGQPQGSSGYDTMLLSDENPVQRMEFLHSWVASQILTRNEEGLCYEDYSATQKIDIEMQKAARMVPQDWWLVPDLSVKSNRVMGFCQLTAHLMHHYLLIQLHLPFILPSPTEVRQDYSIFTCAHASREVLARFISFHCLDGVTFNFSRLYFFALIAIEAVLLAHINSRSFRDWGDILAHQRASDRSIAMQVLKHVDRASEICPEVRYEKSANVLRQLLQIENEAYEQCSLEGPDPQGTQHGLRVSVPFFGIVTVTRQGVIKSQGPFITPIQSYEPQALGLESGRQGDPSQPFPYATGIETNNSAATLSNDGHRLFPDSGQTRTGLDNSDFLIEEDFPSVDTNFFDSIVTEP